MTGFRGLEGGGFLDGGGFGGAESQLKEVDFVTECPAENFQAAACFEQLGAAEVGHEARVSVGEVAESRVRRDIKQGRVNLWRVRAAETHGASDGNQQRGDLAVSSIDQCFRAASGLSVRELSVGNVGFGRFRLRVSSARILSG